jgi:pimeloyl-ACP methyl ester carboxylesterase
MGGLIGACLPEAARAKVKALVTLGAPLVPGRADLHRPRLGRALVAWSRAMHRAGRAFPGLPYGKAFSGVRRVAEAPVWMPTRLWLPGSMEPAALDAALHESFSADSFAVFADLVGLVASDGKRAGSVDVDERVRSFAAPLLVIVGTHDELAPPKGARLLHDRAPAPHKELLEVHAGHIDLVLGTDAPRDVWAPIARFLRRHIASTAR